MSTQSTTTHRELPEFARLPRELDSFLQEGKKKFRCNDGDWEVRIRPAEKVSLGEAMPVGSVLIADNGCGDHLFLKPTSGGEFETVVYAFWHEDQRSEVFAAHIKTLTEPPPPGVSKIGPVFYDDGTTKVRLGDEVSARNLLIFRRTGRITYVPGTSKKNRNMEFNGLCWVGIRFQGGSISGVIVDPKTFRLRKGVRFIRRLADAVEELKPEEDFE